MELLNQNANQGDRAVCVDTLKNNALDSPCFVQMPEDQFYIQPTPFIQTHSSNFYKVSLDDKAHLIRLLKIFLQTIPSGYLNNYLKRRATAQAWILRNPEHKLVGLSDIDHDYLLRRCV